MDRCKLEYLIKPLSIDNKKKMVRLMDPYGDYKFNSDISKFLVNTKTEDKDILMYVGPYHLLYIVSCEHDNEAEYRDLKDKEYQEIIEEYQNIYKAINEFCKVNKIMPFFKDPMDVEECEKTRLDLVDIIPESIINKFYGVESIRDFVSPEYIEEIN